jgi:surface protein
MFYCARSFNEGISSWDTSKVTQMNRMCSIKIFLCGIHQVFSIMRGMFQDATSFHQDISSWDTLNVTCMVCMFQRATLFDQNLSGWDVSNVTERLLVCSWVQPRSIRLLRGVLEGVRVLKNSPIATFNIHAT